MLPPPADLFQEYVPAVQPENINGIIHSVDKVFRPNMPDTGHHCQGDAINLFFFGAVHFK
jgi:hypothetical protein